MMRVAVYCRVSTEKCDQQHSFLSQKIFFSDYINNKPEWVLTEIYADEGITGTAAAPRSGFLKMINDASMGGFDLIITKEVSRFSRNIIDAISYTRKLKELGVGVIFLSDGISTLEADAELRLGIMASVAQEESRKTSERVRWGQQRRMEQGVVFGRSLLGFDVKDGRISVEPEGADIVRQIYWMFLNDRIGVRAIARKLTSNRTPTKTGGEIWSGATILKILKNEKYCGDLVQKKTVTTNYLTHKKKRNLSSDLICLQNHHEAIISREVWEAVQLELKRRAPAKSKAELSGNKYALSGKIVCAGCGAGFICRTRKRNDGLSYRIWYGSRCSCAQRQKQIREEVFAQCMRQIIATYGADQLAADIAVTLKSIFKNNDSNGTAYKKEMSIIQKRKIKLIEAFLDGDISNEDFAALKQQYEHELCRFAEKLESENCDIESRISELSRVICALSSGTDTDDDFYLSFIEKVEVVSAFALEIHLKELPGIWRAEY